MSELKRSPFTVEYVHCEICGEEFELGTMHYDDTCDECAKEEGLL